MPRDAAESSRRRSRSSTARRAAPKRTGTRPSRRWSARSAAPNRRRRCRRAAPTRSIVEHDLSRRCATFPTEARGWQAAKTSVKCQSCQAISVFDPDKVGQRCEFCGSAQLVPYEQVKDAFRPESLLPFEGRRVAGARSDPRVVQAAVARAEQPRTKRALTDTVKGIYLPYWTFDAQAHARVDGRVGHVLLRPTSGRQARAARAAGRRPSGELIARLRRRAGAGVARRARRQLLQRIEPFPTGDADSVRPRLSRRLDGRALSDRSGRRRRSGRAQQMDARAAPAVRRAGARRHASQPAGRRRPSPISASSTSSCRSGC